MNLYEFEGKKLFEQYGILIPKGILVLRGEDAGKAYRTLDRWEVVVKAQTHERGRMEKGLIRFCSSEDEVLAAAKSIFATAQMNADEGADSRGYVSAILIEEKLEIEEERYFSILYDEKLGQPVLSYGSRGGESERHALDIRADLDIPSAGFPHIPFAQAAWNLFRRENVLSLEIDPLVKTKDGMWVAADARVILR